MKVLVIPDVHLKPELFDRASKLLDDKMADRAVCLMDIPDDWKQELNISLYEKTFDRAIKFATDYKDTLWCYGNHDLSYVWSFLETGFSPYAISIVNTKLNRLKSILPSMDQIAYIHRIDNALFLHGGLTMEFVDSYVPEDRRNDTDKMIRAINKLDREIMWRDNSPIWFRPQYSEDAMYGEDRFIQVVGHTPVKAVFRDRNVISCDVFSTNKGNSPLGTCEFAIIDTVTGGFSSIK